ncbi:MAG: glycosyltransferase family 87 protein [Propionicimonas sp.]
MAESTGGHWLNSERVRVYPRLFLAVYALVIVGYALSLHDGLDLRGQPVGADFVTFYSAAKLVLAGTGLEAYDLGTLSAMQHQLFPGYALGPYAWFYPPTFLLLIAPLALLAYLPALLAFVGGTAAAWVVALRRAIGRPGAGWLIAAFPGLWVCAAHGQNGLLTGALAGGAILLVRRAPLLAGVLIGLLAIKPQLAILFAVALVATRAWRTLLAAAATAAAFLGVSLAVFGLSALPAWVNSLQLARLATESGNLPWNKMPSTFAMLRQMGVPVDWSYAGHALVAFAGVLAVWVVWRRTDSLQLRGAVLMAGTFLVNPYAFDYDLVWLAFPIAWLACHGLERSWRRGDREVLVAAWVLPALATSVATFTHVQLAPLVLGALVWIAVRRVVHVRLPEGFVRLGRRWGRLRPGSRQPG